MRAQTSPSSLQDLQVGHSNGASVGQLDRVAELLGLSYAKGTLNPSWELSQIEQVSPYCRPYFLPPRVRTELFKLTVVQSLAPPPVQVNRPLWGHRYLRVLPAAARFHPYTHPSFLERPTKLLGFFPVSQAFRPTHLVLYPQMQFAESPDDSHNL